jgi:hypothetical protein
MKTLIYKIYLIAFVSFWVQNTQAQDPNWSVNAASYQYSMTFTTFLNVDGITLTSANDKVAAFVNGEIRGVANVTYVASANKYVAYLSVYSNTNNETISFKIYNSSTNRTVNIDKTEMFSIDEHKGGIFQSYSIASPLLSDNVLFNSFKFEGITAAAAEISSNKINIVLPENTALTSLTSVFSASQNARVYVAGVLQASGIGVKDFTNPVIYNVLSEDEAIYKEYEVSVSVALNNDPVTVAISSAVNLNTNTIPVLVDIVFSKVVSGFVVSDFILENTAIIALTTSDFKTYKVEVVPLSQGEFSVQIAANSALDENNNQNQISNKIIFTYDVTKPIITDISINKDADSWWFLVTFNEDVLNVDVSDFELKGMGSNNAAVSAINLVANNQYKVAVSNTNSDEGTISLQLKSTSDIKDISENAIVISEYESYFLSKKRITITAAAKTKVYGEADPELIYTITTGSLENGDVFTGGLSRVTGENVGDYIISSTLSNVNYNITFVSNNLSITQRVVIISADAKTKIVGEADPELTYAITQGNLVTTDNFSGNLTRELGETIGVYVIQQGNVSLGLNYAITFLEANFEITASLNVYEFNLVDQIKLYPNPTTGLFYIEIPEQLILNKITIYDVLGKIVLQNKNKNINLNQFMSGGYFIKINTDSGIALKRIVKQ